VGKKKQKEGRFVLRLEYPWSDLERVERAVDTVVAKGKAQLFAREPGVSELGRFTSKSEARRIGATVKGKLAEDIDVELRIREAR
jgi:hypothetical protein